MKFLLVWAERRRSLRRRRRCWQTCSGGDEGVELPVERLAAAAVECEVRLKGDDEHAQLQFYPIVSFELT